MNILYISTNFFRNTSASIRNISLVNGLIENDINVDVLTLDYNQNFEDLFLKESLSEKIRVFRINIQKFNKIFTKINQLKSKNKNYRESYIFILKELVKKILFFPDIYCEAIKNSQNISFDKKYDYIISSSDFKTSHFIAQRIIKKNNYNSIPWIQIWGDPWADDTGLKDLNFFLKKRIEINEKRILKKADKIFYLSYMTANKMKIKYPFLKDKIFLLYRSYLKEIFSKNIINDTNKIIFSYTGGLKNRNVFPILNTIKNYNKTSNRKIIINFYGIESYERSFFKNYDFVNIYPRVSFEEVLKIYSNTDILLYIDNLYNSSQIPGKIYDYFGTNKVILALVEGEGIKKFLEKFKRVDIFENRENCIDLEKVIKKINLYEVKKEFSPKNIAQKFIQDIEKI